MSGASGAEQRLHLLGHPVGHSKSAVMYNAVYGELGLPWRYDLLDCPQENDARTVLEERGFLSVNITTPYKPLAYRMADERTRDVACIEGANVLVNRGGRLIAYNTDGLGCTAFLRRAGFSFAGARIAICGTGPTALAILTALAFSDAAEVTLLGRRGDRARAVLEGWRARERSFAQGQAATSGASGADPGDAAGDGGVSPAQRPRLRAGGYDEEAAALTAAGLVINATPLGMNAGDPAPFDTALLRKGAWAFDCVYGHGLTAFVAGARAAGCRAFDGGGMLVGQAVATVRILMEETGTACVMDDARMFELMADAAGFDLGC